MRASLLLRSSLLALALSTIGGGAPAASGEASAELPHRTSGLWRITTISPEVGMQMNEVCIGEGDSIIGPQDSRCATPSVTRTMDQVVVTIECGAGDRREVTSLLFTGDFRSWYRAQSKITYVGPLSDERRSGLTIDARFLGANCNAGRSD